MGKAEEEEAETAELMEAGIWGSLAGGGGVGRLVAGGVGGVVETARGNVSDRSRVAADGSR